MHISAADSIGAVANVTVTNVTVTNVTVTNLTVTNVTVTNVTVTNVTVTNVTVTKCDRYESGLAAHMHAHRSALLPAHPSVYTCL